MPCGRCPPRQYRVFPLESVNRIRTLLPISWPFTPGSIVPMSFRTNATLPSTGERTGVPRRAGRVRATDTRRAQAPSPKFGFWTRAFDEYRYDALGRRIWIRSRKSCQDTDMSATEGTECKTSILRRVVWDGEQVLAEIQMPGDSTSRDIPYFENDTAAVVLSTIVVSAGTGDPNRYFGRVVYAHGFGVDHPVSVTRYNYVYALDQAGNPVSPPTVVPRATIMPFWNTLGDAPIGAFTTGGQFYCTPPTSTTACVGVVWPYFFSAFDREHGVTRDNWHGSLLESGRDKSGLQFKRNRYYDTRTGRFTQEDPIGLAGGINLYAYAGNNPIAYTDPFGLQLGYLQCLRPGNCTQSQGGVEEAAQTLVSKEEHEWTPANTSPGILDPVAIVSGFAAEGLLADAGVEAVSEALAARATAIQEALPEATQRFTTTAAARVTTAEGRSRVLVASSEQALRPTQRAALAAGEIAVAGRGHAEITILNAARRMGAVGDAIAVSRPICRTWGRELMQAGVDILTVLK